MEIIFHNNYFLPNTGLIPKELTERALEFFIQGSVKSCFYHRATVGEMWKKPGIIKCQ